MKTRPASFLLLTFLSIISVLTSCVEEPISAKDLRPGRVGPVGEVVAVLTDQQWESSAGEAMLKLFDEPYKRLPQFEPVMDVIAQNPEGFTKFYREFRTVIVGDIEDHIDYKDRGKVTVLYDKHANGQLYIKVGAKNEGDFIKTLEERGEQIRDLIHEEEIKRSQIDLRKHRSAKLSASVKKNMEVDMDMINGYYLAETGKDWLWMKKGESQSNPSLAQYMYVYKVPYVDTAAFSMESLIAVRDSILKKHIVDPDGAFMATETRMATYVDTISHKGKFATIMRGLWKIDKHFEGGPYVSLSFLDSTQTHIITVEGNVYATS